MRITRSRCPNCPCTNWSAEKVSVRCQKRALVGCGKSCRPCAVNAITKCSYQERGNVWVKCAYFSRWKRESQHLQNDWFEFANEARHTRYAKSVCTLRKRVNFCVMYLLGFIPTESVAFVALSVVVSLRWGRFDSVTAHNDNIVRNPLKQ